MNAIELLVQVISDHSPPSKWTGAPLASFRNVANTNRGQIGEAFIHRYLNENGIDTSNGTRIDMSIKGRYFEVKTASEDISGSFQFNHVRLDREYEYLLCLGIAPASIWFNAWRKGYVAEGTAGKPVRMAEGQSVTFKLTKRKEAMRPIEELPAWVRATLT